MQNYIYENIINLISMNFSTSRNNAYLSGKAKMDERNNDPLYTPLLCTAIL